MSNLTRHRFARNEVATKGPTPACAVERHNFAVLSHEQVAAALEITVYRARQKWAFARAWLKASLADS